MQGVCRVLRRGSPLLSFPFPFPSSSSSSSLALRGLLPRRSLVTAKEAAKECSLGRGLFFGEINSSQAFPFPDVLDQETKQTAETIVETIDRFFEEKVDSALIDKTSTIPEDVMQGLKELGLFGLQIPTEYGGLGLSNTAYARVIERICLDGSIAVTLLAHQSIGLKGILLNGNEKQKAKYLPKLATGEHIAAFALTEPSSGSDAKSIKTRATLSPDGKTFHLNGGKIWISNGGWADIFTVFAQTNINGEDKVTAFIVERKFGGITNGKPENKLGIKGSNTCEVHFENTPVPIENVLGEVGGGFKVAMNILNNGRFGLGAGSGSMIKYLIEITSEHARNRKQFGKPLAEFELIKEKFSQMAVDAYTIESMVYMTTGMIDRGDRDCYVEAAICKVFGSEAGFKAANECIQVMGGLGFMANYPYERAMRDSRILSIFEGTNEILRMLIALSGLKGPGDWLKEMSKDLQNPIKAPSALMNFASKRFSSPSLEGIAPELSDSARLITSRTQKFGLAVENLLRTYGKNVINEQLQLKRVANCTIDLYGMIASASRASRSIQANTATKDHEKKLATLICHQAARRIDENLEGLAKGKKNQEDRLSMSLAEEVLNVGRYLPPHPVNTPTSQ